MSHSLRPKDAQVSKKSGITAGEERKTQEERRYSSEFSVPFDKESAIQTRQVTSSAKRRNRTIRNKKPADMSTGGNVNTGGGESSGPRPPVNGTF